MLDISELPNNYFVIFGYFFIKDVKNYLKTKENNEEYCFDGFYELVDSLIYGKIKQEVMLGNLM